MNPIDRAIILDEAKRYTDSQRLAYIEPGKVITFDGNAEGRDNFNGLAKVSSELIDLNAVEEFVLVESNSETVYSKAKNPEVFEIIEEDGLYSIGGAIVNLPADLTQADGNMATKGTYFLYGNTYVSKVILTETIHPIDQKFLTGVCLPVVELSAEIASGENVLTEAESAAIDASFDYGLPLVIKFKTSAAGLPGVEASAILEYCSVPDFVTGYSAHITLATAAPGTLIVQKNESGDFVAIFTPDNA